MQYFEHICQYVCYLSMKQRVNSNIYRQRTRRQIPEKSIDCADTQTMNDGMQRQHGPWVPTVISHRTAALTEWVFSPLNRATALCVFLIFSLFRWRVGKEGSPLCQAARLKSKVGSGCILGLCETQREKRDVCTKHIRPGCMFSYDTSAQTMFLEKNTVILPNFVDSLWIILKRVLENGKDIFPSRWVCSVRHTPLLVHKQQPLLSRGCWIVI